MNHIRQLFPKRSMRLPAAALLLVVGLAFACSESPTEVATDDLSPQFDHKGKPHGKPGGNTNDCGFTPLSITFRDDGGDVLRSDNGTLYQEGTNDGGVHLNGATGRLMLWTSQYGASMPREVEVSTGLFNRPTTDRIYTNGHESETAEDVGCGFLDMTVGEPETAVLEVEMDAEGIVRWGKGCDGNPVDDEGVNEEVTTTRIDESTWTVEGVVGVSCHYGAKERGKRPLTEGPAGAFFMTLEKI